MTAEELQRLTAVWFTYDEEDQPEIPIEPATGRVGAIFDFLRACGGVVAADATYWDPISDRTMRIDSVANAGAESDRGRTASFVAPFRHVRFDGVELPELSLHPAPPDRLDLFWDAGPQWQAGARVAAFFDLLAALERDCGVRLCFDDRTGGAPVGSQFGAVFDAWHEGRSRPVRPSGRGASGTIARAFRRRGPEDPSGRP